MISWPKFSAQFCPRCPAQAAVANWRLQDRSVCDGDGVSVMGHGTECTSVCLDTEIRGKVIFWVKRSVSENFQRENFWGPVLTEFLRTQDSENIVGLVDRASLLKL